MSNDKKKQNFLKSFKKSRKLRSKKSRKLRSKKSRKLRSKKLKNISFRNNRGKNIQVNKSKKSESKKSKYSNNSDNDDKYLELLDKTLPCNIGMINEPTEANKKAIEIIKNIEREVFEISDIMCVAMGKKPLAALDFSSYGRKKLRKGNLSKINKIIDFANKIGVKFIHNTTKGGLYLKSIFYLPQNYNSALKLYYILNTSNNVPNGTYLIGKLLGYRIEDILAIYKRDNVILTEEDIKEADKYLENLVINEPNKLPNISFKDVIDTL